MTPKAFVKMCRKLRALGAAHVAGGGFEATWAVAAPEDGEDVAETRAIGFFVDEGLEDEPEGDDDGDEEVDGNHPRRVDRVRA